MELTKQGETPVNSDVQEYIVRIPKDKHKHFNVMRFNHSLHIDVSQWKQGKMERENNYKEFKLDNEDGPKFGAGSEFGREQRDEARRKKHGIITKKYNPDDQPWLLKLGGKNGKKFKGIREGGVSENASYYVFTQASDGTFEAFPVSEWYNFTPIQCYKALSPEEAEEAFGRREKVFNYFSIMTQKRLKNENIDDDDGEEKKPGNKTKKKKKNKDFKITDFDELGNTHDTDDSEISDDDEDDGSGKKKNSKKKNTKKKSEDKSDEEAIEESDEGDFDDKEMDYITSGSSSGEEIEEEEKTNRDLKGVEDEEALRKLMSENEDEEEAEDENKETEENSENKDKAADSKAKQKPKKSDSSGESSSETSDSDIDDTIASAIFVPQKTKKKTGSDNSAGSSRANTPTKLLGDKDQKNKRKMGDTSTASAAKKQKVENPRAHFSSSNFDGVNEETVRRYLARKPMTASDLLHKFKSKKTKMSSQQLVQKIADVLKRMDLQKSNIKGKMYLSLKNP